MTWNYPGNLTGLSDMFNYVNSETTGLFAVLIVIGLYFISLITSLIGGMDTSKSFLLSTFLTFGLSSIAWAAGLVQGTIVVFLLALSIFMMMYVYAAKE